jgi:hypothetical protein
MATRRRKAPTAKELGEVTKRDFVAIAEILCETDASRETNDGLAAYFRSQNPRFDRERFLRATEACRR